MTNLREFLKRKEESDFLKESKTMFEYQGFYKENLAIFEASKFSRFVLPVFSILTGAAYLTSVSISVIPFKAVAVFLSLVLLVLWEYIKSKLITITFTRVYSNAGTIKVLSVGAVMVVFYLVSVYASVMGAKELHKEFDSSVNSWILKSNLTKEALSNSFFAQIDSLKSQREVYKKSVSYKGKIDIHNKANRTFFENNDKRIAALEKDRREALKDYQRQNDQELNKLQDKHGYNSTAIMILACLIDFLIIASGWFCIFFRKATAEEPEQILNANQAQFSYSEVENMFKYAMLSYQTNMVQAPGVMQPSVGFQYGPGGKPQKPSSTDKIQEVIAEIKSGNRNMKYLTSTYKVNVNTVKNLIDKHGK